MRFCEYVSGTMRATKTGGDDTNDREDSCEVSVKPAVDEAAGTREL